MNQTKEGEREHTEPIHLNGTFFILVQQVIKCSPFARHRPSWLPDRATLRDFASEPEMFPASHCLHSATQCLPSICRPGGSR